MKTIRADELETLRETGQPVEILDVRSRTEFQKLHIDGAHCLPSAELYPETLLSARELLPTEPLYLLSRTGTLAQSTACDLERLGFDNIVVVAGGINAWLKQGLAVVEENVA